MDTPKEAEDASDDDDIGSVGSDDVLERKSSFGRKLSSASSRGSPYARRNDTTAIVYCDTCGESSHFRKNPERLVWFRTLKNIDVQTHGCDVCGGALQQTPEPLTRHALTEEEALARSRFECHICHGSYDRAERLLAHSFTHTGKKPFFCMPCNQFFTRKSTLHLHMRKSHGTDLRRKALATAQEHSAANHRHQQLRQQQLQQQQQQQQQYVPMPYGATFPAGFLPSSSFMPVPMFQMPPPPTDSTMMSVTSEPPRMDDSLAAAQLLMMFGGRMGSQ